MSITLSDIASLSGKGGLFKVVTPSRSGVLLQSLDETKARMMASSSQKLSLLAEISVYTLNSEGTTPLETVLKKIFAEYGADPGVDSDSDPEELRAFLKSVLPDYDEQRVYISDIRKLVKWYLVLVRYAPEVLQPAPGASAG
jgi:hypothetical protein